MKKLFTFILFCCLTATTALAGQFDQYRDLPGFAVSEDGTWCLYYDPINYLQAAAGQIVGGDNSNNYIQVFTEEPATVYVDYTTDSNPNNGFVANVGYITTTWSNMLGYYSANIYYAFDALGANGPLEDFLSMTFIVTRDNSETLNLTVTTTIAMPPFCSTDPKQWDFGYILPDSIPETQKTITVEFGGYNYLRIDFGDPDAFFAYSNYYVPSALYSSDSFSFEIFPTAFVDPVTRWGYGDHYDTLKIFADFDETVASIPVHYCVVDTIPEIIEDTIPQHPEDTIGNNPVDTVPAGPALISNHVFSIAQGKKVLFTRGNLYWDGTRWALEDKQTDRATNWDANHVSHLYWTTTGDEAYQQEAPNRNSFTLRDRLFCDGSDADHYLSIEGQDSLYCPSQSEWNYLFNEFNGRPDNSRLVKYPVSVDGVDSCIVVAPDDYTGTIRDVYTAADMDLIAQAGMLVLPPTGYRYRSYFYNPNEPRYWTRDMSTEVESVAQDIYAYWAEDLGYGLISTICHSSRSNGTAIRLVKDFHESTIEVRVKVPNCGRVAFTPTIVTTLGENRIVETMKKSGDWYTYTIETPRAGVQSYFNILDTYGYFKNYIQHVNNPNVQAEFPYTTGGNQLIELDLTDGDYEWSDCESILNDTNTIWDIHVWFPLCEIGDSVPQRVRVTIEKANEVITDTVDIEWRQTTGTKDPELLVFRYHCSYYPILDYYGVRNHGNIRSYTYYHWHFGDVCAEVNTSYYGPTIFTEGVTITKEIEDQTVYTGETVYLERRYHESPLLDIRDKNIFWRFMIDNARYDVYAGDTSLGVTVITNDTMSVCTFPASLFGPGEIGIHAYYNAQSFLLADPSDHTVVMQTKSIHLTILPGAEIAETTQGTAVYDEETATVTLTNAVIENTEIGITVGAEDAVIEVSGSNAITAEQIGIECATSIEIVSAEEQNPEEALLITAERPIYTPADSITLTITGVNLELECPLTGPAPAREAFLAPRRAIEARHAAHVADYSVISGFEHLVLTDCQIVLPAGAQYSETLRELVEADGTTLVKHAVITRSVSSDLRSTQSTDTEVRKLLHNGQIYIYRGGRLYTLPGQELK